ncbi:MAG: efflux RND transporter periplasmic adaptor subunit [Puniceicoccaceae bacterium]
MKKVLLPFLVLVVSGGIGVALFLSRPKPEADKPEVVPTPIDFLVAKAAPTTLRVTTQGTVEPALTATVSAEVGGLVTAVSPNLRRGRFVREGEVLAAIDPTDYEASVAEARANLLSAETALIQAEADAEQAVRDLEEVGVTDPSPLARREPQLRQARLRVDSAEAALALAEKNLERTRIRSPFDGQVAETFAERGDILPNRGSPVARINGTAAAEIRLPLSRADLRHLDLPSTPEAIEAPAEGKPRVRIRFGGGAAAVETGGRIDRLEGTVDPVTRLRHAVAVVEDPLDTGGGGSAALPFGAFVEAGIEGRRIDRAFRLPIVALVGEDRVRVIDAEDRLRERRLTILQRNGSDMVVGGGLSDGDRVCLTPLEIFVPGMEVRPNPADPESGEPSQPSS